MSNSIRRQDRKLSDAEAYKILSEGEYGVLSMCSADSGPYAVPLNYAVDDNVIYFHCAMEGTKLNHLKRNGRVSFCVVGKTEVLPSKFGTKYESAIAFGTASEAVGEEKRAALLKIVEKYSGNFIEEGTRYIEKSIGRTTVIKISIERFTGKARKA